MQVWGVPVPDIVVVLVPAAALVGFVGRWFWCQSRRMTQVCAKLEDIERNHRDLARLEAKSSGAHGDLYSEIADLRERLGRLEGKIDSLVSRRIDP